MYFLCLQSLVFLCTVMSKCCVKWLISCIHYIKRKSFKDTFRDASPHYNFSHISAQQFSLNSTLGALVCPLRAQYAAALMLTLCSQRRREIWGQTVCDNSPSPWLALDMGLYTGERMSAVTKSIGHSGNGTAWA